MYRKLEKLKKKPITKVIANSSRIRGSKRKRQVRGRTAKGDPEGPGERAQVIIVPQEQKVVHSLAQWETISPGQNKLNL